MRGRNLRRTLVAAGLVAASAVLVLILALGGLLAFIVASAGVSSSWNASVAGLSAALTETEDGYTFTAADYLAEKELWAMLIDENGDVVWQQGKPEDVPNHYTLADVASFTRWYLNDYPVQVRIRPDGLLVAGSPKGSTWKHPFILDTEVLATVPLWFAGLFLLALLCVLGLTALVLSRRFRREQRERDTARSDWINGVSHDIRTPLSMIMGYAGQLETAPDLPAPRREQAAVIRRQSQTLRELVNDLNLTMRLDYEMQPLRRGTLHPAALVRQVAADVLNGGLEERYALEVDLPPETEALTLEADGPLLRRALLNLVNNCVNHNPEGCSITLGARADGKFCVLWVEDDGGGTVPAPAKGDSALAADGGAAHGTGLKLVEQIAKSHSGGLELRAGARGVLGVVRIPL